MLDPKRLQQALEEDLVREKQEKRRQDPRTDLSFPEWCQEHIAIRGKPLSFAQYEYLEPIYASLHHYQVLQKAAQVCISTKCMLEAFYVGERFGAKAIYYLSTDADADDFSQDRINIAIDESLHLKAMVQLRDRGRDNVGLRHVGRGSFYVRGMVTRRKVKSIDADLIVLDELDEADQANKQFALDRVLNSELELIRELSQPSIPDYGINQSFQQSDQRYWQLKCPACSQWNCLGKGLEEFEGRLIPKHFLQVPEKLRNATWVKPGQQYYRACEKCQAPLDMAQGAWIADCPSQSEKEGYQISQLYRQRPRKGFADPADWIMAEILGARNTREKMRVTISIIGVPYGGDRQPISNAILNACEGSDGFAEHGAGGFMGIDQGDDLHIVIGRDTPSGIPQIVHLEHTDDWGRIAYLRKRFDVVATVGDALPNKKSIKDETRKSPTPFWIQYFSDTVLKEGEEGEGGKAVRKVTVDRSESLDETCDMLRNLEIILPDMALLTGVELKTYELFRDQVKSSLKTSSRPPRAC